MHTSRFLTNHDFTTKRTLCAPRVRCPVWYTFWPSVFDGPVKYFFFNRLTGKTVRSGKIATGDGLIGCLLVCYFSPGDGPVPVALFFSSVWVTVQHVQLLLVVVVGTTACKSDEDPVRKSRSGGEPLYRTSTRIMLKKWSYSCAFFAVRCPTERLPAAPAHHDGSCAARAWSRASFAELHNNGRHDKKENSNHATGLYDRCY